MGYGNLNVVVVFWLKSFIHGNLISCAYQAVKYDWLATFTKFIIFTIPFTPECNSISKCYMVHMFGQPSHSYMSYWVALATFQLCCEMMIHLCNNTQVIQKS